MGTMDLSLFWMRWHREAAGSSGNDVLISHAFTLSLLVAGEAILTTGYGFTLCISGKHMALPFQGMRLFFPGISPVSVPETSIVQGFLYTLCHLKCPPPKDNTVYV